MSDFFGKCLVLLIITFAVRSMRAANVMVTNDYASSLTQGAGGPLNLKSELNYDDTRSNAPIAVVMHQYSGASGLFSNVRANAQRLRDQGFFAVSVAMRGREGSQGTRDSGGLEIYDIYDAVEAVKKSYPALVNPEIVYLTGYSGGGGNTMSALTKFPDYFNAGAAFFGMSDYGYDPVDGWYFNGAGSSRQPQLRTDIGDPTLGDPDVTDRYHARASNLASVNNPYTEIHLFVNANETICPPVNAVTYRDNAVAQERFAGDFANITLHIGQTGVYEDFNDNGVNDSNEQQYWPHNAPTADQQHAAEAWFMGRLLAGQIPRPELCASGTLHVAGFVKTARFECRAGDGQQGFLRLGYGLTETNMVFGFETLSLNKQLPLTLIVDTAVFTNRRVEVWLNGALDGAFNGGGIRQTSALVDGAVLELRAAGPAVDESPTPPKL
ncbi:MAG: prolyl oligopeptidase family serine peptidase, partial [Kiritimatiellae bacterium]|nr:prolyl oligopeptidase family serine peptidase [Kiritimatiellia bacterium]